MRKDILNSLMSAGNFDKATAKKMTEIKVKEIMSGLAALHEPDMVSGGYLNMEPTRMGRSDVNSSIGASWKQGRVQKMDEKAAAALSKGFSNDHLMNVTLEVCRGNGLR